MRRAAIPNSGGATAKAISGATLQRQLVSEIERETRGKLLNGGRTYKLTADVDLGDVPDRKAALAPTPSQRRGRRGDGLKAWHPHGTATEDRNKRHESFVNEGIDLGFRQPGLRARHLYRLPVLLNDGDRKLVDRVDASRSKIPAARRPVTLADKSGANQRARAPRVLICLRLFLKSESFNRFASFPVGQAQ